MEVQIMPEYFSMPDLPITFLEGWGVENNKVGILFEQVNYIKALAIKIAPPPPPRKKNPHKQKHWRILWQNVVDRLKPTRPSSCLLQEGAKKTLKQM